MVIHSHEPEKATAEVITPLSIVDLDAATDEEIIAAYIEEGTDAETAEAFLNIIRGRTDPRFFVD